ncbi:Sideroflexin [Emiliania huxleyi CCMP1516]|uniref:Sideroflexin n=2 Tax=Emiliania huxleyi TaxID=2903 RepID=A0A0D3KS70_EMIH1|nr:Sideroflexin [Emiliania huxleyi CCMP1516]EOD38605.1 Sideroflexin [Emiliania huxleyi CCMP1516]|eukprot:XP_005791034.1 Sideroflexin [Emiliania huxleyi CCMP1516]
MSLSLTGRALRAFALSRAARLGAGCAAAGLAASQTECLGADARRISESCDAVGVDKSPSTGPRPLMEQLTNPPPFGSGASRFDMSTYGGRALHFLNVLGDPTTLWTSAAELEAHRDLLRRHAKGEKTGATDAELWRADKVVTATTRGETGEMVPAPFRFSFFAYANLVICAGLLRPDASLASACVFWRSAAAMSQGRFIDASTARGSYNAGVNWCNRSSGEGDIQSLATAYVAATGAALAIGVGGTALGKRAGGGIVRLTVPMLGVALSAVLNLVLTRRRPSRAELDGVPVYSTDGMELGISKAAGVLALTKCSEARILWTFLLLTVTPVLSGGALSALPSAISASPTGAMAVDLGATFACARARRVTFACIWLFVPLAMAVWPQRDTVAVSALEEQFQGLKDKQRRPIEFVEYNKGL